MSNAKHLKLVQPSPEGVEPPPAPVDPMVGTTIDGRYRIEKVLGQGGMGVVYTATHAVLGKRLAIKVLKSDVSKDQEIIQRFRQEAQSASAIGSQHIIDISDFGSLPDGSTYFVMEYLDGMELTKAIEEQRPMPADRVVHIAKQLCDALGAAHERGIVHRDMKPDNVFLIKRGANRDFVKVLDFGIAKVGGAQSKLTRAGQVFGTPHYMSPEQCSGQMVDHRTDIYALGVILYEMSVGRVPFDADNLMGILTKHIYEQPIPPHTLPPPINVPAGLEAVILKCLAKQADARYQSMAEVRADLEAFERGTTPTAVMEAVDRRTFPLPDPTGQHSVMQVEVGGTEPPSGSKLPLILGFLAGLLVIAAGAGALYLFAFASEEPSTPPVAQPEANPPVEPVTEEPVIEEPVAEEQGGADETEAASPEETVAEPVMVRIVSDPPGVEVWSGGALLGNTPFAVPRPENDDSLVLVLKQPSYRDHEVRLSRLTQEEVRVTLARERRTGGGRQPQTSTRDQSEAANDPPQQQQPTRPPTVGSDVLDPWAAGR